MDDEKVAAAEALSRIRASLGRIAPPDVPSQRLDAMAGSIAARLAAKGVRASGRRASSQLRGIPNDPDPDLADAFAPYDWALADGVPLGAAVLAELLDDARLTAANLGGGGVTIPVAVALEIVAILRAVPVEGGGRGRRARAKEVQRQRDWLIREARRRSEELRAQHVRDHAQRAAAEMAALAWERFRFSDMTTATIRDRMRRQS